jgi:protein SCO1/2
MKRFIAVLLTLCIFLPGCTSPASDVDLFHGQDLPGEDPEYAVSEFTLTGIDGNSTNLSDYDGQVLIISFIYSRCPDVCPIVSSNLRWVSQELSEDYEENFSIISVTVDPWYDSRIVLGNYATIRNLSWPHLTGDIAVLEPVWEAFHVGLQTYVNSTYVDDSNNTSGRHHPDYLVDHSTSTFILDKDHKQRVRWDDLDWEPTLFVEDVQQLMEE